MARITWRIGVIFLLFNLLGLTSTFAQTNERWIHLGTLWDVPANIDEISPNSLYVSVSDGSTDARSLVRLESGEIIAKAANGKFDFSSSGRYAVQHEYGENQSKIYDLETGNAKVVEGYVSQFIDHEQYISVYQQSDAVIGDINRLINLNTGDIVAEFTGGIAFSADARLAAVTNLENRDNITTQVIEIASGKLLAQFTFDYSTPSTETWGAYPHFHANGRYLSIYYFPEELQVIDTTTWQVLYRVPTGIGFSADGRYSVTLNDDGYSEVQLMDASNGQVLDSVFGSYGFSDDSQYLFRSEALTYDNRRLKVIDLNTKQTVFEYEGVIGNPKFLMNTLLQLWDRQSGSTHFFDITTGEQKTEIKGQADLYQGMLVINDLQTPILSLHSWESPETIALGKQVEITPDGKYALVSNGLFVDVYGLESNRPALMPPPRPEEGIARAEAGEIRLYPNLNTSTPRVIAENNLLNPTYMYVLGQAEGEKWLYVVFDFIGWIEAKNVSEIKSWAEVPILDDIQPLETLKAIAYRAK